MPIYYVYISVISKSQPNPLCIKFQLCPRFSFIPLIPISRLNNDESKIEVTGPNLKKNRKKTPTPRPRGIATLLYIQHIHAELDGA